MKSFLSLFLCSLAILSYGQFSKPTNIFSNFPIGNLLIDDIDHQASDDFLLYANTGIFKWFSYNHDEQILLAKSFKSDFFLGQINALHIQDMDGDGDTDYVIDHAYTKEIAWLEKIDNDGRLKYHFIDTYQYDGKWELKATDLDKDGLMDIVAIKDDPSPQLMIYKQKGKDDFEKVIIDDEDREYRRLQLIDADADGDLDIFLVSDFSGDRWTTYENLDGLGRRWAASDRDGYGFNSWNIRATDLDLDGYMDIVQLRCDGAFWFRGTERAGVFEMRQISSEKFCFGGLLSLTDIDGDGFSEILLTTSGSARDKKSFILRRDGFAFSTEKWPGKAFGTTLIGHDFNGDGIQEIIFANERWYLSQLDFITGKYQSELVQLGLTNLSKIAFYDLDDDQDQDLIINDGDGIVGYERLDSTGLYFNHIPAFKLLFEDMGPSFSHIDAADFIITPKLDNDPELELVVSIEHSSNNYAFSYYEHQGGFNFSTPKSILRNDFLTSFPHLVDLNRDNRLDIVYWNGFNRRIEKILSIGEEAFSAPSFLINKIVRPDKILSADMDLDGDLDVVFNDGKINWIENIDDGTGPVNSSEFSDGPAKQLNAIDIDLDGDFDFVKTYFSSKLGRFILNDGQGALNRSKSFRVDNTFNLVDIDRNKSVDLLADKYLYRNTTNTLNFETIQLANIDMLKITTQDLDKNGDLDIVFHDFTDIYVINNFYNDPALQGRAFWDENQNGRLDSLEQGLGNLKINIKEETSELDLWTQNDGQFLLYTTPDGALQIRANSIQNWKLTTDSLVTLNQSSLQDSIPLFGYAPQNEVLDAQVSIAAKIIRCNRPIQIDLNLLNQGTLRGDFEVVLKLDRGIVYISSSVEPISVNPDDQTLVFQIEDLAPLQQGQISINFQALGTERIGENLVFSATVFAKEGTDESTQLKETILEEIIRCAYDPNDKLVAPNQADSTISGNDLLTYTIRFQNTGNDTAFNIRILDTLNQYLDIGSVKPLGASHDYVMKIEDRIITFDLKNIYLPDSTTDLTGSNGYVQFEVALKDDLSPGTEIKNSGAIYFDLNPPIYTNRTLSRIEILTDIRAITPQDFIQLFPNPAEDHINLRLNTSAKNTTLIARLIDASGRLLDAQQIVHNQVRFKIEHFNAGIYFLQVQNSEGAMIGTKSFIKK
ncbi:MAG: hypothetical protein Sapg2KO_44710 [Saprospiraceae bacterium]